MTDAPHDVALVACFGLVTFVVDAALGIRPATQPLFPTPPKARKDALSSLRLLNSFE